MRHLRKMRAPWVLVDVEATDPIPEVCLPRDTAGMGVTVRRKGRPVHFFMEEFKSGCTFPPTELEGHIFQKSGIAFLRAAIQEELTPLITADRFPSLTIAVCTRERPRLLARCLESLGSIEPVVFGKPVSVEILVIDNAPSTDRTQALTSARPGVRYAVEPRPGLDFARNRALREARGELIAYVDDDAVVDKGWLTGLMEAWAAYPGAACFTGQVLPLELITKAQILFEKRGGFRRGFDPIRYGAHLDGHPAYPCSVGIIGTGANMAFRKRILHEMNGFDEALDTGPPLPAAGDHDIFYRLIRAGHSIVYTPTFLVFHEHRKGLLSLTRQYWSWGLGVMSLMNKINKTDPAQRKTVRYLVRLWFQEHAIQTMASILRKRSIPWYMVLAETAGGVVGLCGGYGRSGRRIGRIRKEFPSGLKAESIMRKAAGMRQSAGSSRTPDASPPRFKPWEILNLDLSHTVPALPSGEERGGIFVVFWWKSIPLGQGWIFEKHLPMRAAEVRERALDAIAPAVASYLFGISIETSSANEPLRRCPRDLKVLSELEKPLEMVKANIMSSHAVADSSSVSVVVCSRDRPGALRQCLSSLQELSQEPDEIIVVDNAPRSNTTYQVVSQFPNVRYLRELRPGLDVARNRGIVEARGEIVAFTDDDAVVHPDWIARICNAFNHPHIMAVTGLVLPAELGTEAQFLFETHWRFGRGYAPKLFDRGYFESARSRGVPVWEIGAGANMAFRRDVFNRVGLFDERLDVGAAGCSGDSEMWYRILAGGWSCRYEPAAVVYHYHRKDMEALRRQLYHYMRGHVTALLIQFEKHRHWGNLRRLAVSLPWYYAGLARKRIFHGLSGRESALNAEMLGAMSGIRYYLLNRHNVSRNSGRVHP